MRNCRAAITLVLLAGCGGGQVEPAATRGTAAVATVTTAPAIVVTAQPIFASEAWSFESDGEKPAGGWTAQGEVPWSVQCGTPSSDRERLLKGPLAQPYKGAEKSKGLLAQLGGTYWRVPLDLGQDGKCRAETRDKAHPDGGGGDGSLLSKPLPSKGGFISFLVGGGGAERTRAELCVEVEGRGCQPVAACGDTGPGVLGMRRVICDLKEHALTGKTLRIRVTDRTKDAPADYEGLRFIAIDDVRAGAERPPTQSPPAWGFADLHAHFFGNLGHGGRLIYGDVIKPMAEGLKDCEVDHATGGLAFSTDFNGRRHETKGYPEFKGWPKYSSKAHQQTHIDWIERAYRGGLRLVQVDVGHNQVFARAYDTINRVKVFGRPIVNPLPNGKWVYPWDEDSVRKRQIEALNDFVTRHASSWAALAESPAQARAALEQGKMVLVAGLESDEPGPADKKALEAVAGDDKTEKERRAVVRLYVEGLKTQKIRHVFPVHVIPNVFGTPAVYERRLFCAQVAHLGSLMPLMDGMSHGVRYQVNRDDTDEALETIVEVAMSALLQPGATPSLQTLWSAATGKKESCFAKLEKKLRSEPAQGSPLAAGGASPAASVDGVANARKKVEALEATMAEVGLSKLGKVMIEELMRAGMLIDLTHMSQRSREDTIAIAKKYGYPLMASHGGFRDLSFGNTLQAGGQVEPHGKPFKPDTHRAYGTTRMPKTTTEASLGRQDVAQIKDLGGIVGLHLHSESDGVVWTGPFGHTTKNDCDGSSKSFVQRYRYALTQMGAGIALGTDVNGFAGLPPPRFGKEACRGADGDGVRGKGQKPPGHGKQEESTMVRYSTPPLPSIGPEVLVQDKVDAPRGRAFDLNTDGVAHYGLLPDFLQDMRNVGVTPEELAVLFRGVEDYVRMWERAEKASLEVRAAIP